MKLLQKGLWELRQSLLIVHLCHALLDSFIVFVLSLFVYFLFRAEWRLAFIPFVIFFGVHVYHMIRLRDLVSVEKKVYPLRYALRTADETQTVAGNELVDDLHQDVLRDLKLVRTSYLIDYQDFGVKIFVLLLVTFFVGVTASLNVDFSGLQGFLETLTFEEFPSFGDEEIGFDGDGKDVPLTLLTGNVSDIYGESRIAQLGDTQLDLTINPSESDINLNDIGDVEEKSFTSGLYPQEIRANYDQSFQDDIPQENHKVVKNYFVQISK